ncbi:hypothetical protein S245_023384, partial [Arachis hypogaea]
GLRTCSASDPQATTPRLRGKCDVMTRREEGHEQPETAINISAAALISQGTRVVGGGAVQEVHGHGRCEGVVSRRCMEVAWDQQRDRDGTTQEAVAGGSDTGERVEVEATEVDMERRELRVVGENEEPMQALGSSCNMEVMRLKRAVKVAGHSNDKGKTPEDYNTPEDERHIRSKTDPRLEEGEILTEASAQGHRNRQENDNENGTGSGSETGAEADGDGKLISEEQRPSWNEKMAENKEAWKLAVESGAQY